MIILLKRGSDQEQLAEITRKLKTKQRKNNLKRWCGIVRLKKNPITIQKEMRDEWS